MGVQQAAERGDEPAERGAVERPGRRASRRAGRARPARRPCAPRPPAVSGADPDGDVGQRLGDRAAEPDQHDRSEHRVAAGADDEVDAGRRHRLDEHPARRRSRPGPSSSSAACGPRGAPRPTSVLCSTPASSSFTATGPASSASARCAAARSAHDPPRRHGDTQGGHEERLGGVLVPRWPRPELARASARWPYCRLVAAWPPCCRRAGVASDSSAATAVASAVGSDSAGTPRASRARAGPTSPRGPCRRRRRPAGPLAPRRPPRRPGRARPARAARRRPTRSTPGSAATARSTPANAGPGRPVSTGLPGRSAAAAARPAAACVAGRELGDG